MARCVFVSGVEGMLRHGRAGKSRKWSKCYVTVTLYKTLWAASSLDRGLERELVHLAKGLLLNSINFYCQSHAQTTIKSLKTPSCDRPQKFLEIISQ